MSSDDSSVDQADKIEAEETNSHDAEIVQTAQAVDDTLDSDDEPIQMRKGKRLKTTEKLRKKEKKKRALSADKVTKSSKDKTTHSSVEALELPYRATKRIMKLCPGSVTVQIEAVLLATYAAELFTHSLSSLSFENAKKRRRNVVRYEDIAEVRATNETLNFLDTLFP